MSDDAPILDLYCAYPGRPGDMILAFDGHAWTFAIIGDIEEPFVVSAWIEDQRIVVDVARDITICRGVFSPDAGRLVGNRYPAPEEGLRELSRYRITDQ